VDLVAKHESRGVFRSYGEGKVVSFQSLIPFTPVPLLAEMSLNGYKDDPIFGEVSTNHHGQGRQYIWGINNQRNLVASFSTKADLVRILTQLGANKDSMSALRSVKASELTEVLDTTGLETDADASLQVNVATKTHKAGIELSHPLAKVAHLRAGKGQYNSGLLYTLSIPWAEVLNKLEKDATKQINQIKVPIYDGSM
jgi:hypothetical protein